MAEATLGEYCDEAKELIRADSYDQAIAICRHILKQYPRYVRAYRVLGEACLEKGDYIEAANLFKRVLGADMEDMVVYVGLGIVFDEQGALDEAIWQLERAFELNPGNAEIRKELQRLYSDRDGAAPRKLKLTSAALGRLYMREELYQRAIDEFRAVLEQDPERADIQIALAQALWWSERRQEAAKICEALLEQYPNCLKANLILGEILLSAGRQSEAQSLLDTAQAMDPENVVAHELFHDRSPLPSETVTVPRLDQEELGEELEELRAEAPVADKGRAARNEGSPPDAGKRLDEATPDWLRKLQEEEKESTPEEVPTTPEAQEMPAWLRELAEESPEQTTDVVDAGGPPSHEIGEGIPQWLGDLRDEAGDLPSEEILPPIGPETVPHPDVETPAPDTETGAEAHEILASPEDAAGPFEAEGEVIEPIPSSVEPEEEPGGADEAPDWLRSLRQEAAPDQPAQRPTVGEQEAESTLSATALPEGEFTAPEEVPSEITEQTMDRLRQTMPGESASIDEIMAWMEESKALLEEGEIPAAALEELQPTQESEPLSESAEEEQMPTWLRDLRPEAEAAEEALLEEAPGAPTEEAAIPTQEDEMPAWLREMRPKAMEDEALLRPQEMELGLQDEDLAAGRKGAGPLAGPEPMGEEVSFEAKQTAGVERVLEEAAATEEPVFAPEEPTMGPPEEPELPVAEEEEMPSWLRDLREEATREQPWVPLEEPKTPAEETPPAIVEGEMPSWLRNLRAEAAKPSVPLEEPKPKTPAEETPPAVVEEEMPSWLRQLRAEATGVEPLYQPEGVELPTEATEPLPSGQEEVPPWLQELRAETYGEEPPVSTEEPETLPQEDLQAHVVEAELPSWLQELKAEVAGEQQALEAAETEAPTAETPSPPVHPSEERQPIEAITPEEPGVADVVAPPLDEHVPSWLRELRAQAARGETGALLQRTAASHEPPFPAIQEEELPSWLRDLRAGAAKSAAAVETPAAEAAVPEAATWPGEEAEAIPQEPLAPPAVEEKPPVAEAFAEAEEVSPERPLEETPQPEWDVEQYIEHLDANPRDHTARLALARTYSQAGELDQAALQYQMMLSFGGMIREVTSDLEITVESAPDHLRTQELLADAYMRTGQLQKALDKYRWLRVMLSR